jgi:hypothetical protein
MQVFTEWVEQFSNYTRIYGQIHPVTGFSDPDFMSWLKIQWGSMSAKDPFFPPVEQFRTLSSVQWIEAVSQIIEVNSMRPAYEVVTGRSKIVEMDGKGCPLIMKFIGANRSFFENEAVASKEKIIFIFKALEENFPTMLEVLRSERANDHPDDMGFNTNWEISRQIQEAFTIAGRVKGVGRNYWGTRRKAGVGGTATRGQTT